MLKSNIGVQLLQHLRPPEVLRVAALFNNQCLKVLRILERLGLLFFRFFACIFIYEHARGLLLLAFLHAPRAFGIVFDLYFPWHDQVVLSIVSFDPVEKILRYLEGLFVRLVALFAHRLKAF